MYTIGVSNSGQQTATNLAIDDACPSGTSSVSSSTATGSYSSGTWSLGSLANAASVSLTLTCSVQSSAAGSTVSNSISDGDVTFDQEGSGGTDNVSGASVSNSVNSLPL
ncbi:MAG: hypothetical protein R3A11_09720 [Bdellovibrionota bacterium]